MINALYEAYHVSILLAYNFSLSIRKFVIFLNTNMWIYDFEQIISSIFFQTSRATPQYFYVTPENKNLWLGISLFNH